MNSTSPWKSEKAATRGIIADENVTMYIEKETNVAVLVLRNQEIPKNMKPTAATRPVIRVV